jgi:alpha-glucosidase (family GH31 glycosyl hydrolase)
MKNTNLTRREFLDGALKTTLAATAISALGAGEIFAQSGKPFVYATAHGDLEISNNPFAISLKNKNGKVLLASAPNAKRNGVGQANGFDRISRVVKTQKTAGVFEIEAETAGKKSVSLKISDLPNSILLEVKTNAAETLALAFRFAPEEFTSGAGQRIRSINLRGYNINSVARVNDDGIVRVGSNEDEFSAPTPFFLSSKGYGLFVDTDGLWNFDFGKAEKDSISILAGGAQMRMHLFTGANPKEIVRKFTNLTGRMQPAPDWNFGLWKWRDVYRDEFEAYEDASMMRSLDLPAQALIIDSPWSSKHVSFDFNPQQFPNGKQFLDNLRKQNYKIVFWLVPFINPNAPNFKEADERGYFVKDASGKTLLVDWWNPTGSPELGLTGQRLGGMIDFTFPEATAWWQNQVQKMVEAGVDGWKLDDGEFLPLSAKMHDGRTGAQVKSAYTMWYHKAVFEVMERTKKGDYAILPRAVGASNQKYMTSFWAGDQNADFDPQLGLPSVIIGAQTLGMCGYPVWTSDTGGYRQSPKPAVLARWTQFSALCPLMIFGGKSYREPWHYADEIESIVRRYAQLHHELLPYIKRFADIALRDGTPIIRPMFLEFADDAETQKHEFQYMFGSDLLVAPVYTENNFREVYLPRGRWLDFHTLEFHDGAKTIEKYDAPLWKLPLFVRISGDGAATNFYRALLAEQLKGFFQRCDFYLEIRGKFIRPQPFDRFKKLLENKRGLAPNDAANVLQNFAEIRAFVDKEETEGSFPYFTAKNLRERIAWLELSVRALEKLRN